MGKKEMGNCKHGKFFLLEGCPRCIDEHRGVTYSLTEKGQACLTDFDQVEVPIIQGVKVEVESPPGTDMEVLNWHTQALSLKEYAEKRVIKSVEDMKYATDDLSIIAHLKKAMEERRKQYVKPLQEQVKVINDTYKTLMEPVEAADRITRDKILGYQREQEKLRKEQEEINRLREEAAQRQKELTGEITEIEKVEVAQEAPRRVSTEMGVAGTRDNWKWEVLDINLVPREYLMINAGMLTPIVKASKGRLAIPGIRIYNEPIIAVNTK